MKHRIFAFVFTALAALPLFAHDDATGMHISTKSPKAHALFEEAMSKIELLHVQAGLENLRKSVQADPHFALGHIMLTFFSEDPAEQVRERDKALATRQYAGPEEQMIIDWLANASRARWIPAIQAMNGALDRYPQDKHLAWLAGWWLAVDQNQSPRAVPLFERVIKIDPYFVDAWNEAAYCYAKAGDFDKAFADIKRYAELVPFEANPQDSYAELSRMAGRFDEALEHYRMSLKLDPDFHESQLGLGDTYALMGDEARARVEYAKAIAVATPTQQVLWGLQSAATYVREGDYAGADGAYRQLAQDAHARDFANLEAEAYRSMALYQKDPAVAADLLAKAEAVLHEQHKVSEALLNEELASVLRSGVDRAVRDGDWKRAQALLQRLSDLAASNSDEMIGFAYAGASGAVFLASGKYPEAISDFEGDPTNPLSMRGLYMAYDKAGQKENAARLAAALASFNIPVIEQALVVPEFRKQRADAQGVHASTPF
jgi:tetratricopeptide (TPR) repeat protein